MRMLREKEVENKDKKQNMFAALFVVIGFLSFSLWICDILLNKGQSRQLDLFLARMTDFLADFTNTSGYCAFRSPYDNIAYSGFWHKQYPPFAYVFFLAFFKIQLENGVLLCRKLFFKYVPDVPRAFLFGYAHISLRNMLYYYI